MLPGTNECWFGDRAKESNARSVQGNGGSQGLVDQCRPQKAWRDRDTSVYSEISRNEKCFEKWIEEAVVCKLCR